MPHHGGGGTYVFPFPQEAHYGKEKNKTTFQWRKPDKHDLSQWLRSTSTVMHHGDSMPSGVRWCIHHFVSMVFLSQAHSSSLIIRKTSDKSQWRSTLRYALCVLLKTASIIKKQGKSEKRPQPRGA